MWHQMNETDAQAYIENNFRAPIQKLNNVENSS